MTSRRRVGKPRIRVIATQHLDVAYLWERNPAGEELMIECFERTAEMLDACRDRSFRFSRSTAWSFYILEHRRPDLFTRISEYVREGRIEVAGGQWVEPDNVLPGGEAMVRQGLYGQRYFEKRFGKTSRVAWNPDVFGHPATLPQILIGCGLEGYYFHRCIPTDSEGRQVKQFVWRGQDGTEVLCFAGNWRGEPVDEVLEECARDIKDTGLPMSFTATGANSDRRVTMEVGWMQAFRDACTASDGPPADWSCSSEVLDDLQAHRENLPIVEGDLGFQFTGTYTTEANIKRQNRRMEALVADTEKLALAAHLLGNGYPAGELRAAWQDLCLNGFHDIICGTCYQYVHEEALDLFRDIESRTASVLAETWRRLIGTEPATGITLFNPLSGERREPLLLPASMRESLPGPVQEVDGPDGEPALLVVSPSVPSLGFQVLESSKPADPTPPPLTATSVPGALILENRWIRAEIDPDTGELRRLVDLTADREILHPDHPGNRLAFYGDQTPLESFEPWYIDYTGDVFESSLVEEPRILEHGPLRAAVRFVRRARLAKDLPPTTIEQQIRLYADLPYLVVSCTGDWQARHTLLKAEFNFAFPCRRVISELGYGILETTPGSRPGTQTVQKDSAVEDGLEQGREIPEPDLPMHRWVDYEGKGHGVAVLNNGKYGFDAHEQRLRLSLMRAPVHRDGNLVGLGRFSFDYAILPHTGDWRTADIPFHAACFNHPLLWHRGRPGHTAALDGTPLLEVSRPGVAITAVKLAEDGEGVIVRLFESTGRATQVVLSSGIDLAGVEERDLIERPRAVDQAATLVSGREVHLSLRPFEIRTLLVRTTKGDSNG